eukprot:31004-Rhodomonas_salina.1
MLPRVDKRKRPLPHQICEHQRSESSRGARPGWGFTVRQPQSKRNGERTYIILPAIMIPPFTAARAGKRVS